MLLYDKIVKENCHTSRIKNPGTNMEEIKYNDINHVCFLMDGDRTFAIIKRVEDSELNEYAYYSGAMSLERLMSMTFRELRIKYLSLNLVGRRNCIKRPGSVKTIVKLVPRFFGKKWAEYFVKNKIRVRFVGDIDLFCSLVDNPEEIKAEIRKVEYLTSTFSDFYLILMAAYEPTFEYMKLAKSSKLENLEDMKKEYYGFSVPDVNILIRSWRPKLSGCLPIMVSDYPDIYFFAAPFQYFKMQQFNAIIKDYTERTSSSSITYEKEDMEIIRKYGNKIKKGNVMIIGKKVKNIWLPFR